VTLWFDQVSRVWPNLRASGEQKKSLLLVIIWNFDDSRCSVLCIDLQGSREKDRERVRTAETPARWNKFEQCQQRLHHVLLMETPVLWFLTLRKKMVVFAFVWASKASRPPCASCCLSPWGGLWTWKKRVVWNARPLTKAEQAVLQ
jgi:hypothetical protein